MKPCPKEVGGARVICYTPIDERHRFTGNCQYSNTDGPQGPMVVLAICQYKGEDAFFLFGCDAEWQAVTDTWHHTLTEAKEMAEWEYEGVSETWIEATDQRQQMQV